ncbi:MAG: hypothetical protein HW391_721 [Chloroflexi bacterium]|nr:hypothetical protein [Chloroflexota bacterium]
MRHTAALDQRCAVQALPLRIDGRSWPPTFGLRWRRRVLVLLVIGSVVASACRAAEGPDPSAPGASVASPSTGSMDVPATDPGEAQVPSDPISEPPILGDESFHAASVGRCANARPVGISELDGPAQPAVKVTGYEGLHIVLLEMLDANGTVGPPPPLPPGEAYYPASTSIVSVEGATEALPVESGFASDVELLACVVLRAGRSAQYSGESGELTVVALNAVVWMVDHASGTRVAEPWVTNAELGTFINTANILEIDGSRLLPADIRPAIAYFMGQALPLNGAYQGGAEGYVVAEFDVPADLPSGTQLLPGHTFVVRLVILGGRAGVINFIDVLCAPAGIVTDQPMRVATDVHHDVGRFTASSADIEIDGDFSTEWLVAGQIRGVSGRADACGIPRSTAWEAALALRAEPDDGGYSLIP